MIWTVIHIIDILLWLIIAGSVVYVCFFAFVSLLRSKGQSSELKAAIKRRQSQVYLDSAKCEQTRPQVKAQSSKLKATFLVLYPAYHEDAVIVNSVRTFLQSDYPEEKYHVAVISDHMKPETNDLLASLPITLLQPTFEKSSKAKALQYAIEFFEERRSKEERSKEPFDYVVIMDADNVVRPDFLTQLNKVCQQGYKAIQCHRCAKNSDNDIAVLDGVSEEINNSLFRRAHNAIGLSSALIGSGMCFDYLWFHEHVNHLCSAVEDRELEALLMKENIFVKFVNDIPVYDEKVSDSNNFQRQRLRWMSGQVQTLFLMLPYLPKAIMKGNINYIDKTIQQALIPRSILLLLTGGFSLFSTILALLTPLSFLFYSLKWWVLFGMLCMALFIAMPAEMRTRSVFSRLKDFPRLAWLMMKNLSKISLKNKDFLHTTHNK